MLTYSEIVAASIAHNIINSAMDSADLACRPCYYHYDALPVDRATNLTGPGLDYNAGPEPTIGI